MPRRDRSALRKVRPLQVKSRSQGESATGCYGLDTSLSRPTGSQRFIALLGGDPVVAGRGPPCACWWKAAGSILLGDNQARRFLAVPAVNRASPWRANARGLGSFGPVCEMRSSTRCLRVSGWNPGHWWPPGCSQTPGHQRGWPGLGWAAAGHATQSERPLRDTLTKAIAVQPPAKGGNTSTREPAQMNGPSSCGLAETPSTRKLHTGVTVLRAGKAACRPWMTSCNPPGATVTWSHPAAARAPAKNRTVTGSSTITEQG